MPEFGSGGHVYGPSVSAEDPIATLQGCTVHGKPHPRVCDADCNGEWVIPVSALNEATRKSLNEISRSVRRAV